jgi:hypothetical protein
MVWHVPSMQLEKFWQTAVDDVGSHAWPFGMTVGHVPVPDPPSVGIGPVMLHPPTAHWVALSLHGCPAAAYVTGTHVL